jgi:hypothetical protein
MQISYVNHPKVWTGGFKMIEKAPTRLVARILIQVGHTSIPSLLTNSFLILNDTEPKSQCELSTVTLTCIPGNTRQPFSVFKGRSLLQLFSLSMKGGEYYDSL